MDSGDIKLALHTVAFLPTATNVDNLLIHVGICVDFFIQPSTRIHNRIP